MATYAIGDVQGCLGPLMDLLDLIEYQPAEDELWFAGDLINRGPESLETLRFIQSLKGSTKVVLGNHDLHLIAVAKGHAWLKKQDTLNCVLQAPDRDTLIHWLIHQPLVHYDPTLKVVMSHAGIPPCWTLDQTLRLAKEAEELIQSHHSDEFFAVMYGNQPDLWKDSLQGMERMRAIVNYLTRMRFCDPAGKLDLKSKEGPGTARKGYSPWFQFPSKIPDSHHIVFGHWAALEGQADPKYVHALDTGCVWGGSLTALRLDDWQAFSTPCKKT